MPAALQLEIQGASGTFVFDVQGEWTPSIRAIHKPASEPPEVEQLLWTWEFDRCRIVPSDGLTPTLWADIQAFLAQFEGRTQPTSVRLVRDPAGTPTTELQLAPPDYENLRFNLIEGEQDPDLPAASWGTTATFRLEVTATRKFADTNGVVGWNQEVRVRHEAGLRILEWDTTITTREGTSAVDVAKNLAAIDISTLPSYTLETNGPDAIDYEILDGDEPNSRVPTQVQAISRVRQWGVPIGATGGGVAPDSVFLEVKTRRTPEETITTTFAQAVGPNAEQWVRSQAPGSATAEDEITIRAATREAIGLWERRTSNTQGTQGQSFTRTIEVVVSGGRRAVRIRPIAGGFSPRVQRGAFLQFTAEVSVTSRRQGGTGAPSELPLPAELGDPWILDSDRSRIGDPVIAERKNDPSQHVWERRSTLVYVSATKPTKRPAQAIAEAAADVPGYLI